MTGPDPPAKGCGRRRLLPTIALSLLFACGPTASPDDSGPGLDAAPQLDGTAHACDVDEDCGGAFCDGEQRCLPNAADCARECVVVEPACEAGSMCDEEMRRCVPTCSAADADGDGVEAIDCGGSDCDDADPNRYPGNVELNNGEWLDLDTGITSRNGSPSGGRDVIVNQREPA